MRWSETYPYHDLVPRDLEPPYLRIAADMRRKVAEAEWLKGEQIPSLDKLAVEYGVSRVTARKSVLLLVDEGLLETRPAWGTFVRS
jgi:GntR family transcriptional regulator